MPTPGAIAAYQSRLWHGAVVKAILQAEALVLAESTRLGTVSGVIVLVDKSFFPNEWVSKIFSQHLKEAGWEVCSTPEGFEVSFQEKMEIENMKMDMSVLQSQIEKMRANSNL